MLHKNSLFKKFTVFGLLAFVIIGVILGFLIMNPIKNDMIQSPGDIIIVMSLGLLVLYLLLLKIVHSVSRTLVSQKNTLQEQKEAAELSYQNLDLNCKNTLITLSNAVDARDPYTAGHSGRVAKISLEIGNHLGLGEEQLHNLECAALFHDIGKLGMPDKILQKPQMLTAEEFDIIKDHPAIGVHFLKNIENLELIHPIILHHHERFAGNGYPDGIKGDEIPLESRIIAVADAYDAMITDRPYRKGLTHNEAVLQIIRYKAIQFDPDIVDAFFNVNNKFTNLKKNTN